MNLEERLVRDAESFAAEVEDFDEEQLIARVFAALGFDADDDPGSDDAPAAGRTAAGPAGGLTSPCEGRAAANSPL